MAPDRFRFSSVLTEVANNQSGAVDTLSFSLTLGATANHLVVGVMIRNRGAVTVDTVTVGGVACTQRQSAEEATTTVFADMWDLHSPSTGAQTVAVTLSSTKRFVIGAVSLIGVDATTPRGTPAAGTGTTMTATVEVSSATDELVVDVVAKQNNTEAITVGASQTQRVNDNTTNATEGNNVIGGMSTEPGAEVVGMTWDWTTTNRQWAIVAIPFKAAICERVFVASS